MSRLHRHVTFIALTLAAWFLSSAPVSACATCYGKSDSPLAQGMNMGIFALLGVVLLMWVAFGAFFIFLARRAKATALKTTDAPSNPLSHSEP